MLAQGEITSEVACRLVEPRADYGILPSIEKRFSIREDVLPQLLHLHQQVLRRLNARHQAKRCSSRNCNVTIASQCVNPWANLVAATSLAINEPTTTTSMDRRQ